MKLLIFLCLFQFIFTLQVGWHIGKPNIVLASEVSSSGDIDQAYNIRYEQWLANKERRLQALRKKLNEQRRNYLKQKSQSKSAKVAPVKPKTSSVRTEKAVVLPKTLPAKTQKKSSTRSKLDRSLDSVSELSVQKKYKDAQSEFINSIPKDNKQAQSLLTMIDHAKVYFSINSDGQLKDLFKDERFQEIYREEMTKPTRKMTYNFFKGYQDENRIASQPIAKTLNRDIRITREKLDTYLETTGIKSKLTRALQGRYPAPQNKPEDTTSSTSQPSAAGDSIE